MCGIAGIVSFKGIELGSLKAMSKALQHRGPDGFGYLLYYNNSGIRLWQNQEFDQTEKDEAVIGFAHRRLSIIDLSAASLQPMVDEMGAISVVYNGEIYNYLELRTELERLGYTFRTRGDTEVLLKAYLAWGLECVQYFNGMWAFVLLDIPNQRLVFSRDRFGIKPLYYTIQNDALYFASEIKGLLAAYGVDRAPNETTVARFLLTGLTDHTDETFFDGIFKFPAAHSAAVSLRDGSLKMQPRPYWSFPSKEFVGTEPEAVEQFRSLFLDAVSVHARSDVPVGTCLSGGLDSSSIVCISEILRRNHEIPNYSHSAYGYCPADEQFSERTCMQTVVDTSSIRMHYVEVSQRDFISSLRHILKAQDEPFGSASIAVQWAVFRCARETGMIVMLDGQGADEIMAGYHYYFNSLAAQLLSKLALFRFLRFRAEYQREIGPFPLSLKATVIGLMPPILRRALRGAKLKNLPGIPKGRIRPVMCSDLLGQYVSIPPDETRPPFSLNNVLKKDVQSVSLPALLRYEDRNSMAHSIEARVPFLDYRLVDFVFTLPDDWKIRGTTTKYILRQAMRGILPETIRLRKDKLGFKAAPNLTFKLARQHRDSIVDNRTELEERWFRRAVVERIIDGADQSFDEEFALWRIINTKLWVRQFWGDSQRIL